MKERWVGPSLSRILVLCGLLLSGTVQAQNYAPTASADLTLSARGNPRLVFDPSGTRLAASLTKTEDKGRVVFLNVPDLSEIRVVKTDTEPYALAFSPQGDYFGLSLARPTEKDDLRFVVLSTKGTEWSALYAERGLQSEVASLEFDPVGDLLYVGGADPNEIYRFVVGTWQRERIPSLEGLESPCRCVDLSPNGRFGAIGASNARVLVWPMDDSGKGSLLGSQQFKGSVEAVAFSPDSRFLAAGDSEGVVMVFYATPDGLWAWKSVFNLPDGGVRGLAVLNDSSLVTLSSEGRVSRWNPDSTGQPLESFDVGPGNALALAVDPTGRYMAVGGEKILLYPIVSSAPPPVTEMPAAPWTIVGSGSVDLGTQAPAVPSVKAATSEGVAQPPAPPPTSEDHGNLLLWVAPSASSADGQDWIQVWAGGMDEGRYSPLQLVLPYESLSAAVLRSNFGNLNKVLTPKDFSVMYAAGVLGATKEGGEASIAYGPKGEEVPLGEWIKAVETSNAIAPTLWFLDLRVGPNMKDDTALSILSGINEQLTKVEGKYKRTAMGVGLLVLSREGAYPELVGNLPDALSGKGDENGDGTLFDRELILYLADRCRTALRVTPLGDAKNAVPVLPPFRLGGN
ncbi:MAG: hypothetical protein HUU16_08205 [Candidatus Omnitrophica bacterium]|nr:hypothetical protein [Candidatus Omnitrophota bacterium]